MRTKLTGTPCPSRLCAKHPPPPSPSPSPNPILRVARSAQQLPMRPRPQAELQLPGSIAAKAAAHWPSPWGPAHPCLSPPGVFPNTGTTFPKMHESVVCGLLGLDGASVAGSLSASGFGIHFPECTRRLPSSLRAGPGHAQTCREKKEGGVGGAMAALLWRLGEVGHRRAFGRWGLQSSRSWQAKRRRRPG